MAYLVSLITIQIDTYGLFVTVHQSTRFTSICDPTRLYLMRTLKRSINGSEPPLIRKKKKWQTRRATLANASDGEFCDCVINIFSIRFLYVPMFLLLLLCVCVLLFVPTSFPHPSPRGFGVSHTPKDSKNKIFDRCQNCLERTWMRILYQVFLVVEVCSVEM